MSNFFQGLVYNKEKAGIVQDNADEISEKIVSISKDTKFFELQKKRSKRANSIIEEMKFKLNMTSQADKREA